MFLRLGRLEEAIAEYRSVLDDPPLDWNTANALGDLFVRAGLDLAVAPFVRTVDTLAREGFVLRASALYKKILKFRPDHEYSLLRATEITANQGLMADAVALAEVDLSLELATIGRADGPEVEGPGASTKTGGAVTTDLEEELRADGGDYRDIAARAERLSKRQARE